MDTYNSEEHWVRFAEGNLSIHCGTEELANEFIEHSKSKGISWSSEQNNNWNVYDIGTCYWGWGSSLSYSSLKYARESKSVTVDFRGIFEPLEQDTYIHITKPKPPLGVTPKDIHDLLRVQDLCRALHEYSTYEEVKYDSMIKWSKELVYLLETLEVESEDL